MVVENFVLPDQLLTIFVASDSLATMLSSLKNERRCYSRSKFFYVWHLVSTIMRLYVVPNENCSLEVFLKYLNKWESFPGKQVRQNLSLRSTNFKFNWIFFYDIPHQQTTSTSWLKIIWYNTVLAFGSYFSKMKFHLIKIFGEDIGFESRICSNFWLTYTLLNMRNRLLSCSSSFNSIA